MAIKLYGAAGSTATLRVRACLAEKDLDYEYITIDMANKEHKNPNSFPVIHLVKFQLLKMVISSCLVRKPYELLAHTYADKGNNLIINDPKKMAILSVWLEVESQKFEPAASKLTWELILKPMFGMTTDDAVVAENEKKLSEVLDVYESRLSESKYLAGDSFTLADLHHLPNVKYLMGTKVKSLFDARPHVGAWAAEIQSRPAWVKVITS